MTELYSFMATANSTLDESLENEPPSSISSLHGSSLPASAKATPRGLPSAEASWRLPAHVLVHISRKLPQTALPPDGHLPTLFDETACSAVIPDGCACCILAV